MAHNKAATLEANGLIRFEDTEHFLNELTRNLRYGRLFVHSSQTYQPHRQLQIHLQVPGVTVQVDLEAVIIFAQQNHYGLYLENIDDRLELLDTLKWGVEQALSREARSPPLYEEEPLDEDFFHDDTDDFLISTSDSAKDAFTNDGDINDHLWDDDYLSETELIDPITRHTQDSSVKTATNKNDISSGPHSQPVVQFVSSTTKPPQVSSDTQVKDIPIHVEEYDTLTTNLEELSPAAVSIDIFALDDNDSAPLNHSDIAESGSQIPQNRYPTLPSLPPLLALPGRLALPPPPAETVQPISPDGTPSIQKLRDQSDVPRATSEGLIHLNHPHILLGLWLTGLSTGFLTVLDGPTKPPGEQISLRLVADREFAVSAIVVTRSDPWLTVHIKDVSEIRTHLEALFGPTLRLLMTSKIRIET
ncbi:MAG: hypothetical protein KTR25_20245 [Myxococcales bacterium]|nr:hypothetical protein [Myxococcales bacterium]